MVFSPDNAVLASTGRGGPAIRLWEVATGRQKALLLVNSQNTVSLVGAFSMDGRTLTSCEGNDARLWNVAAGKPLFSLLGLGSLPCPPRFSPDGNRLVTGGSFPTRGGESPTPIEILEAPSMKEIEAAEGL
jgi:WD40 repeat protein